MLAELYDVKETVCTVQLASKESFIYCVYILCLPLVAVVGNNVA